MFGALLLALFAGGALAQGAGTATAQLEDNDGNPVGDATFTEGPNGVTINANLQPGQQGVEPGEHGIHIHEFGVCDPSGDQPFSSAGGHFNPTDATHPNHAGDLGNMVVLEDMTGHLFVLNDAITLGEGDNSLFDADGSAIVIHAGEDDMMTDPGGNSGARVACGVITVAGDTP